MKISSNRLFDVTAVNRLEKLDFGARLSTSFSKEI